MTTRAPLVVGPDGLDQQLQPGDTIPLPAFAAAGVLAGAKLWVGEATTNAAGAWSVDLSAAGFSGPPAVFPQAVAPSAAARDAANATVVTRTKGLAAGTVTVPATIVLGGLTLALAGAGLTVMVIAVGS